MSIIQAVTVTIIAIGLASAAAAGVNPATSPQPANYAAKAREVMAYFQKTFWDDQRGLYTKGAADRTPDYIWREAAAFAALTAAARHEPRTYRLTLDRFFRSLNTYWDDKAPIPGYEPSPTRGNGHDKYYDDNAWVIIAFAEAYELTGEQPYLDRARETARFVLSGWDDQLGGGIWWHASHKDGSKNACANGPAAVGFLRLAQLGPKDEADGWATAARKTVDWTRNKLQASDGLFDDRIIVATGEVKRGKLTYNSALMLRAELGLYVRTGQSEYLKDAQRIGKAAAALADRQTGVYRDPLKWSQFMVEADLELYRVTGEAYLLRRAQANADAEYAAWNQHPAQDMMSNAATARILWLMSEAAKPKDQP